MNVSVTSFKGCTSVDKGFAVSLPTLKPSGITIQGHLVIDPCVACEIHRLSFKKGDSALSSTPRISRASEM